MSLPAAPPSDRVPTVSVTICLHEGSAYIVRALASVFAQTCQDFEVVLVDDGSTDGGADLVMRTFDDPRLRIIRQANQGLGGARAAVVAAAAGEFIAFLDQDDEWLPDKLAEQVDLLRRRTRAGLVFTDCTYIDGSGSDIGRASAHFGHASIDFTGPRAVRALLTRGCFIDISSVMARAAAICAAGGFNPRWRYVEDYDLWLRMARMHEVEYLPAPLTRRRLHPAQFTQRHHACALAEESALLRPMLRNGTYPPDVKRAIRHYLFGQHRTRTAALWRQRRLANALRAVAGAARYPAALSAWASAAAGRRLPRLRALKRRIGGRRSQQGAERGPTPANVQVWVDGSPLQAARTGCFNLTSELIRTLARTPGCEVQVFSLPPRGRLPLWARVRSAGRLATSRVRGIRPTGSRQDLIELVSWRGRFRMPGATRLALLPDLTPRLTPELHTPHAIRDFDRFVAYAMRRAHGLVTISEHSRRDILRLLPVFPESVHVIPVPLSPLYATPCCARTAVARHGIAGPYLLCVSTREPRKNLRRLVNAFHTVAAQEALRHHELVLAGPNGWDAGFEEWLRAHPAAPRVRCLGFVPAEDLPSLYRFADVVVYPSLYEGFGLPVLEAMSCSGLVLASRVSALPELLGPGGRYFNPDSEEDIGQALVDAIRLDPGARRRYRSYCRDRAEHLRHRAEGEPALPGLPRAS
jgi:glycosyltransferase involved in cell wall biosynthesis